MPHKNPVEMKEYKRLYYLKNREAQIASHRKWNKENKHIQKDRDLRKKFNIGLEDYKKMLEEHKGVCAICGGKGNGINLSVDHNHVTKKIRGLLCCHCNFGIGYFKDNPELLRKAVDYLNKHDGPVDLLIS
jgi:hypothetical protein